MQTYFKVLTIAIVSLTALWTPGTRSWAEVPSTAIRDVEIDIDLVDKFLEASGVEDRPGYVAAYRDAVNEVVRIAGTPRSGYRRAKRIYDAMRNDYFRKYNPDADGFDAILDRGEYNCLSASLFYGLAMRGLGFEAQIVEAPFHVFVRLAVEGRRVDVETTSARGFDLRRKRARRQHPEPFAGFAGQAEGNRWRDRGNYILEREVAAVDLERALAFVWHNTGNRALERGDAVRAARSYLEESKLRPDLTSGSEVLASHLARAFRQEYEAGRFLRAYQIAEINLKIFPGHTSARDRLLAVALKRIEQACEEDDVARAERILDLTIEISRNPTDATRLERGACPLISVVAVRLQDWSRAHRMSKRFAASQPDPIESARLAAWVRQRARETQESARQLACANFDTSTPTTGPAGLILFEEPRAYQSTPLSSWPIFPARRE